MNSCCCSPGACHDCSGHIVCHCLQFTETMLRQALVTLEIRTLTDIRRHTGAGEGCTACHQRLQQELDAHLQSAADSPICSVR